MTRFGVLKYPERPDLVFYSVTKKFCKSRHKLCKLREKEFGEISNSSRTSGHHTMEETEEKVF